MAAFNYSKMKKQAARPQVGPWWYYKGQVHGVMEPAPYPLDFSYSKLMHAHYWRQMGLPGGSEVAHERGRVESTPQGFVIITSDTMAANPQAMQQVMSYYSIPPAQTRVTTDEHYNRTAEDEMFEAMMSGEDDWGNDFDDGYYYDEEAA
tara:strand:+ start:202641 stop:203087 length:447 start_codon:yes stop_codon:yes gene_type:complete